MSAATRRPVRLLLDHLRSRPGARVVQGSSPALRGGNLLYLWQWAFLHRAAGGRGAVLEAPTMDAWREEFPLLEELTIAAADVRLADARAFATRFFFDADFDREQNAAFCRALVASSSDFRERLDRAATVVRPDTVVINVRRGDYYGTEFSPRFAIDVAHHVRGSLDLLREQGVSVQDVLLVSDDLAWCRTHVAPLLPAEPRVDTARTSMFDDLALLASSRTLVLANSTFSYWGSYLALSRDRHHRAVAPSHHETIADGTRIAPMFDPRWPRTDYRSTAESNPGADAP